MPFLSKDSSELNKRGHSIPQKMAILPRNIASIFSFSTVNGCSKANK